MSKIALAFFYLGCYNKKKSVMGGHLYMVTTIFAAQFYFNYYFFGDRK